MKNKYIHMEDDLFNAFDITHLRYLIEDYIGVKYERRMDNGRFIKEN